MTPTCDECSSPFGGPHNDLCDFVLDGAGAAVVTAEQCSLDLDPAVAMILALPRDEQMRLLGMRQVRVFGYEWEVEWMDETPIRCDWGAMPFWTPADVEAVVGPA